MAGTEDGTQLVGALSRGEKKENAKEIFKCQCSKCYLTFSALYLHVKLKHNIRLTNKKTGQNHRVQFDRRKKIITYFLKQTSQSQQHFQNNNLQNQLSKQQKNRNGISLNNSQHLFPQQQMEQTQRYKHWLQSCNSVKDPECGLVIDEFASYIQEIKKLQIVQNIPQLDLPLFFNEFVTYYVPMFRSKENIAALKKKVLINTLYNFWKWLKEIKLTQYELHCQEQYTTEPNQ